MPDRFIVTGSGRHGSQYVAALLTAAGVPCGHEQRYAWGAVRPWPPGLRADSSWMAACHLDQITEPVVLLVRHPLLVARSWARTWLAGSNGTPAYGPLRRLAPEVHSYPVPADRGLAMWLALTSATLDRAELVVRLEDTTSLRELLRWAGAPDGRAEEALASVPVTDRYVRQHHDQAPPVWGDHAAALVGPAQDLAKRLGYDLEVVSGG